MVSKHFRIYELVPKHIYQKYEEKAWWFIDERLILTIDKLKELLPAGAMTINDYHWKGNRNWSGLRTSKSPYYRETSQHSFGRAVDIIFSAYPTDYVRNFILENIEQFPYIKGIEMNTSWLHIDIRNSDELIKFNK